MWRTKQVMNKVGARDAEGNKIVHLKAGSKVPRLFSTDISSNLVSLEDYSDKRILLRFYDFSEDSMSANGSLITLFKPEDLREVVYMNFCVDCDFESWKATLNENTPGVIDLVAEGSWGEKIKKLFQKSKLPYYVLLDTGNLFYSRFQNSASVTHKIDSMMLGRN